MEQTQMTKAPEVTKRFRFWILPAVASLTAGISLWFIQGSLDIFPGPQGAVRVAMLPSGWNLLLCMILSLIAGIAIALVANRIMIGPAPAVQQLFLPLFALSMLALPYLPWLADHVPVLLILAGPAGVLLWFIVLAQSVCIGYSTWKRIAMERGVITGSSLHYQPALAIFIMSVIIFGASAINLTRQGLFPTGDEPHYMVIMQSLLRDGNLKVENNYLLKQYKEYYQLTLRPHYIARGRDGEIYSIHPVGMPVLAAPAFAVAGYPGVVGFLVLVGSAAATLMWRWVRDAWGSLSAATFAWAAACLTGPYLFNTFTVYPEIVGALCVMIGMTWNPGPASTKTQESRGVVWRLIIQGLAIGLLPWLSTKYAPMSAALIAITLWRLRGNMRASLAALTPYALSLAAWFSFFYLIWGSFNPSAPYGKSRMTQLSNLPAGGMGLFFDQEYGILIYAPVFILGLTGLIFMFLRRGETARRSIEIGMVGGALLVTVGSFEIWWGGAAAPCRPVASGLLLLGLPIAWSYLQATGRPLRRAFQNLFLLTGLSLSATLVLTQRGLLTLNNRDGISELLNWISPNWNFWALFPSFIFHTPAIASAHVMLWMMAAGILALLARYLKVSGPGQAALIATCSTAVVFIGFSIIVPSILGDRSQPPVDLEARFNSTILDHYDSVARPVSIIYTPFTKVPAESVPPLLSFIASPRHQRDAQVIPLLWNARFSLPAGQYKVMLRPQGSGGLSGRLGLQVGRNGPPLEEWTVESSAGMPWEKQFALPIDSTFVGFRSLDSIATSAGELELRPLSIVNASQRPPPAQIIAAAAYPQAIVFFHDDQTYPQSGDFWIKGWSKADMSILPLTRESALRLNLRSGIDMTVTLKTETTTQQVTLTQNQARDVIIPVTGKMIRLSIKTPAGYVPSELNPADPDWRRLGCRIEFVGIR